MGTASEVTRRDIPPRVRSIPSLEVDVLMIPAITLWGPINQAQTVVDYDDFYEKYRGFMANYESPVQVKQFFIGGGRLAVINRIVHIDGSGNPITAAKASKIVQTATTAATKGSVTGTVAAPYALQNGDTLIGNVDAVGNQTATITATRASLECANAETYALSDGQTLTVAIDGEVVAQTVTFNTAEFADIANATAEEIAAVINAELQGAFATVTTGGTKVTITSDRAGTGSVVEVTGGTANTALGFSTSAVSGTGNVSDEDSVTIAELKTIIEAAWTNGGGVTVSDASGYLKIEANTAGSAGSVLVDASSTADDEIGLDNATHAGFDGVAANTLKIQGKYEGGTIGNAITFDITAASNGNAEYFNLQVYLNGVAEPLIANLTMDFTSDDYVDTRLAAAKTESMLVDAVDQSATGTATQRRPADVSGAALTGGNDGLDSLADADFVGVESDGTGLYAFDALVEGDIMICPDRATTSFQNSATAYLATNKKRTAIFIPDPPLGLTEDQATTHFASLTQEEIVGTRLPWPGVKIPNPDKSIYGSDSLITIKPSGSIAGRLARNTQNFETHVGTQPGNEIYGRLANVVDVENTRVKRIGIRRKITPLGINPIIAGKDSNGSYGVWLNDVQALKIDGNFKSIGECRVAAAIGKAIMIYLETIRNTPNTVDNRTIDKGVIEAYLETWLARKVFISQDANEAYYINTDPLGNGINNALVQEREEYKVVVAIATARSRRFVELQFTRDQRAVELALQQQIASP